jgi:hypothetical protein
MELEMFRKGVFFDPLFIAALVLDKCRFFCHQFSDGFFTDKGEELHSVVDGCYKYFLDGNGKSADDIVLKKTPGYIPGPGFQGFIASVCDEFFQRISGIFALDHLPEKKLISDFALKYVQERMENSRCQLVKYGLSDLPCGVSASDDITFMVIKVLG